MIRSKLGQCLLHDTKIHNQLLRTQIWGWVRTYAERLGFFPKDWVCSIDVIRVHKHYKVKFRTTDVTCSGQSTFPSKIIDTAIRSRQWCAEFLFTVPRWRTICGHRKTQSLTEIRTERVFQSPSMRVYGVRIGHLRVCECCGWWDPDDLNSQNCIRQKYKRNKMLHRDASYDSLISGFLNYSFYLFILIIVKRSRTINVERLIANSSVCSVFMFDHQSLNTHTN